MLALIILFVILTLISYITSPSPIIGLSTILGISVLGSSVLGSSVLGSSVLGSSVLANTIVESYINAVITSQLWLSLAVIGLLAYIELADPMYGNLKNMLSELRKSWLPISILLTILFFIIVAIKVLNALAI
jgi:hypothetical protein